MADGKFANLYVSKIQEGHRGPKGPAPSMATTKDPVSVVPATKAPRPDRENGRVDLSDERAR